MSRRHDVQSADGVVERVTAYGILQQCGTTVPADGTVGYAIGCLFQKLNGGAGTSLYINEGTAVSAAFKTVAPQNVVALAALGVAAGYRIARGIVALDGTNPTPVTTGLTTVVSATASLEGTSAPGVGTSLITVDPTNYSTGVLNLYAWKVTNSSTTTLIASTGTENVHWIAIGT